MAPIFATDVGIMPQIIDDVRLHDLRERLTNIELRVPLGKTYSTPEEVEIPLDIDQLAAFLEPWQEWRFEEQVRWPDRCETVRTGIQYLICSHDRFCAGGLARMDSSFE